MTSSKTSRPNRKIKTGSISEIKKYPVMMVALKQEEAHERSL